MMVRGDGFEVQIRTVTLAGDSQDWRSVVFFTCLIMREGPAIQAWYLSNDGELQVATANKFRQVSC